MSRPNADPDVEIESAAPLLFSNQPETIEVTLTGLTAASANEPTTP